MKLSVNKEKCIGCGFCVSTCEEIFNFDDDSQAKVIVNPIPEDKINEAKAAKEGCPTEAIEEE
ncbi:MAG: ferredoxin [Bacilli bacterium]